MAVRGAVCVAVLVAGLVAAASAWGQDDVDRLRAWQERQDEFLLARQRVVEERRQLGDDLLLERQNQQADAQLQRERQQDEQRSEQDKRLNDRQRLSDDLQQERQYERTDQQRYRQDLQDQGQDERQQLGDELAKDREQDREDLRRQREQLVAQSQRDRERADREREQEQQRREREHEREEQRRERERERAEQQRRWRRDVEPKEAAPNATASSRSYEGAQLWRVEVAGGDAHLQRIEDDGVAKLWYSNASVWDLMVLPANQDHLRKLLSDNNLSYTISIPDLQRAIAEENPALSEEELELTGRKGHRMTWQHYHRSTDMHGWMDYLAKTYSDACSVQTIGNSVEGRPLKVLHIKGKAGSPGMWVDGGIHAREWITSASVSYMVNELLENRDAHRSWLDKVDLYVLPLANPDGYEYSQAGDRMWRKNRRRGAGGNCDGIDLNRNFGYKWGGKGAGPQACQEIYRGAGPFSEPETKAIQNFVLGRKASLKSYLSFHSYGQYVLYPWGYDRFVPPDHADLQRVGNKMANAMYSTSGLKYTVGSSAALLYPASGGSDDWAKGVAGMKYAFTIELRDTGRHGFILPANHILSSGKEVLAAVRALAEEVAAS